MVTPSLQLLKLVWQAKNCESWDQVNHSMLFAARLAVGSGMPWAAKDFDAVAEMRPGYWLGEHGWEPLYALAISIGNKFFVEAFEAWRARPPFFANHVRPVGNQGFMHRTSVRQRERLGLGSEIADIPKGSKIFSWPDIVELKVTNFEGPDRIIISAYQSVSVGDPKEGYYHRKLCGYRKLTRENLAEIWPAPKRLKKSKHQPNA